MKKYLFLSVAGLILVGSFSLISIPSAQAACRVDDPIGDYYSPVNVPATVSVDSLDVSLNGNTLTVSVSGLPSFRMRACLDAETPSAVTISVNAGGITGSKLIANPLSDGYSTDINLDISSLPEGIYPVNVTATSGGTTDSASSSFSIPHDARIIVEPGIKGDAKFSKQIMGKDDTYNFSVTSGPTSTPGELHKSVNGGADQVTPNWLTTDSNGSATKPTGGGSWTCSSPENVTIYIKWPDGTRTNNASYSCLPDPSLSLNTSVSNINRGMGNPVVISWDSSNASKCTGSIDLGLGLGIGGTSGTITIPAEHTTLDNTLLEGQPYPGVSTPQSANIVISMTCKNAADRSIVKTVTTTVFYNNVYWVGKKENSCGEIGTATPLSAAEADQVSFSTEIDNKATGSRIKGPYPNQTLGKVDNRVWGWGEPMIYKISQDAGGNYLVTPPTGYKYCANDGGSYTTSDTQPNVTQYNGNVILYFTSLGGGTPNPPTNFAAIGECHQNNPNTSAQAFLGWSANPQATSYNVYRDGVKISSTSNTWYLDLDVAFGSSHGYKVSSVNANGEGPFTSTINISVPSQNQCINNPPPFPPPSNNPTYVVDPPTKTINVGETTQFNGLYDPDGPNGRYGNFLVNEYATWGITTPALATSLGNGLYRGDSPGGKANNVTSSYRNINATATLNINNVGNPDFTISISPALRTVVKPNTTTYDVSISPLNGFTGRVNLSVSGLHNKTTGSLNPTFVTTQGNSTLTLTIGASAAIERYTFTVTGSGGQISHDAVADINITNPPSGLSCTVYPDPQSGVSPLTTSVTVAGTGGTAPYQYRYDWTSDGTYDTPYTASPQSHTYNSNGTYKITALTKDNNGDTNVCDTSVNPGPPINCQGPTCDVCVGPSCGSNNLTCTFEQTQTWGNTPLPVDFRVNNVQGGDGSYQYQFVRGDGTQTGYQASNLSSYTYNSQGSFTPSANIKDGSNKTGVCTGLPINVSSVPDSCNITANPISIMTGSTSTLSWSCTNPPVSCSIDQGIGAVDPNGGVKDVKPKNTTTYTLSCTGVDDSRVTVKVGFLPIIREIIPR